MSASASREAWGLFWRLFLADKRRRMATLSELGLAPMQAQALQHIEPGKPLPMSALADTLHCDPSNVTGVADRLEAAGLIERRPAEHDRRIKTLALTAEGERVRTEVERRMSEPPAALASLSEEDARTLAEILRRATVGLER